MLNCTNSRYVRPHVEFATPAWSPWIKADIDRRIEAVQRKAMKMIPGLGDRY